MRSHSCGASADEVVPGEPRSDKIVEAFQPRTGPQFWSAPAEQCGDGALDHLLAHIQSGVALRLPPHSKLSSPAARAENHVRGDPRVPLRSRHALCCRALRALISLTHPAFARRATELLIMVMGPPQALEEIILSRACSGPDINVTGPRLSRFLQLHHCGLWNSRFHKDSGPSHSIERFCGSVVRSL